MPGPWHNMDAVSSLQPSHRKEQSHLHASCPAPARMIRGWTTGPHTVQCQNGAVQQNSGRSCSMTYSRSFCCKSSSAPLVAGIALSKAGLSACLLHVVSRSGCSRVSQLVHLTGLKVKIWLRMKLTVMSVTLCVLVIEVTTNPQMFSPTTTAPETARK